MNALIRILGLDPGLRNTGWGMIAQEGSRLTFIACGVIKTDETLTLAERLRQLHDGLSEVVTAHGPDEAAVEETFVNKDARATLKLGHARAVSLLVPALRDISVSEYAANLVKKTIVGAGHADKRQVAHMVKILLPRSDARAADAADALAVAITHAQNRSFCALKARAANDIRSV